MTGTVPRAAVACKAAAGPVAVLHGDVKALPGYVRSVLAGKDVRVPTAEPTEKVDHFDRAE